MSYSQKLEYEQENHIRKSLFIWSIQVASGVLLKMLKLIKYFSPSYKKRKKNMFEFSHIWEIIEYWLVCPS